MCPVVSLDFFSVGHNQHSMNFNDHKTAIPGEQLKLAP